MSESPGCFVTGRYGARQFLAIAELVKRRQSLESAACGIQARAVSRNKIPRAGANEDIKSNRGTVPFVRLKETHMEEYRILIVEDEKTIAEAVRSRLAMWGLAAETVSDFRNVMADFERVRPHLVLMDISLPFMNGYHWCTEIRKASSVPVIFVSSAADNMNIIMAVNMGADDFIAKPFDPDVLVAKVQALLRRSYDFAGSAPVLEHRGAVLNTGDNSIMINGEKLDLTRNEYRILLTLMQNKGKIVSREKLMEALWQTDSFVDENTLTVNVGRLRRKLDAAGLPDFITTKFGEGYLVG